MCKYLFLFFATFLLPARGIHASTCGGEGGPFFPGTGSAISDVLTAPEEIASLKQAYVESMQAYLFRAQTFRGLDQNHRSIRLSFPAEVNLVRGAQSNWTQFGLKKFGEVAVAQVLKDVQINPSGFERGMILRMCAAGGETAAYADENLLELLRYFWTRALSESSYNVFGEAGHPSTNIDDLYASQKTSWRNRLSDSQMTVLDLIETLAAVVPNSNNVAVKLIELLDQLESIGNVDPPFYSELSYVINKALRRSQASAALNWVRDIIENEPQPTAEDLLENLLRGRIHHLSLILSDHVQVNYQGRALEAEIEETLLLFRRVYGQRVGFGLQLLNDNEFAFIAHLHAYELLWQIQDNVKNPFIFEEISRILEEGKGVQLLLEDKQLLIIYFKAISVFSLPREAHQKIVEMTVTSLNKLTNDLRTVAGLMHQSPSIRQEILGGFEELASFLRIYSQLNVGESPEIVAAIRDVKNLTILDSNLRSNLFDLIDQVIAHFQ